MSNSLIMLTIPCFETIKAPRQSETIRCLQGKDYPMIIPNSDHTARAVSTPFVRNVCVCRVEVDISGHTMVKNAYDGPGNLESVTTSLAI